MGEDTGSGIANPPHVSVRTMIGYSVANLGVNMVNAFSNTALPLFLGTYQLPNALIGFLAQERSFVGAFVQPVIGFISDRTSSRWGRRKPFFLVGVPLTVAALLVLSTHPPLWAVLVLLIFFSFFLAVANDPYLALMADITPPEQRGRMGSVAAVFNMLGQVALLAFASFFWQQNEVWVFLVIAVGLIVSFGITFLSIQEPAVVVEPPKGVSLSPGAYVRNVLQHREVAKFAGTQFFFWFGSGSAVPFLTRFGVDELHTSESTAFQLVLIAVVATAISAVPIGMLADRFGKKRVLSVGLGLYTIGVLAGAFVVYSVPQAAVMMAVLGVTNGVTITLAFPLLADLMPVDRKGEFTGLGSLVWSLAQPIGSTWAGLMVDWTGSYRAVFMVAGVMIGLSFLGLQTVRPERAHTEK